MPNKRIAIIGSGPSGFFAAEELLRSGGYEADMFDALPTPYGLVRGGVAPDHPKIKSVTVVYDKTAARPEFRYFGNVEFGRDITLEDLRRFYDGVIFASGARSDRKMDIPGEDLAGSHAATEFVGWYNAHPDYRDQQFDLSVERAVIVGNGNVAMDVTRILAEDPARLAVTDIADHALEALKKSNIKEIVLLGRRGPAQAAFTNPEIRELCELPQCDAVISPEDVKLDPESEKDIAGADPHLATAKKNVEILKEQAKKGPGKNPRKILIRFLVSPVEILGKDGKVSAVKIEKNRLSREKDGSLRPHGTGEFETIPAGLVLRSVGYKGVALPGLPYDERKGTIPNDQGRVIDPKTRAPLHGLYVVGWAKRGPSGVIGTNKPDSIETAKLLMEDLGKIPAASDINSADKNPKAVEDFLKKKDVQWVSFPDWKKLDAAETARGKAKGKPREKYTRIPEMLDAINKAK